MLYFVSFDRKKISNEFYDTCIHWMEDGWDEFLDLVETTNQFDGVKVYNRHQFEGAFNCGSIDPKKVWLRLWEV